MHNIVAAALRRPRPQVEDVHLAHVAGQCLGKAVIDIGPQGLERHPAFAVPFPARDLGPGRVIPMDRISHEHYIRFHLADRPGVLAKISSILAKEGISIATVSQHERAQRGVIPVVMRTHLARESSLRRALARITRLEAVRANPVVIRVEERLGEATDR